MSALLSKIKSALGLKKQANKTFSAGGKLGGVSQNYEPADSGISFDVVFTEPSLGVSVIPATRSGRAEIGEVRIGSSAAIADVRRGDVISHVDGNPVNSFDDFDAVCAALGRPVTIRYNIF